MNKWKRIVENLRKKRTRSKSNHIQGKVKKRAYTFNSELDIAMVSMNEKLVTGVGSFDEYVSNHIHQIRYEKGNNTSHSEIKVISTLKQWNNFIRNTYETKIGYRIIQTKQYSGWIIDDSTYSYIDYYLSGDTLTISFVGDRSFIDENSKLIESQFDVVHSYIKWVHDTNGNYISMALNDSQLPIDEMYPWLKNETLEQYYERYLNSTASIILLIGPPGTGKTTWIKGLLAYSKSSAMVTYDPTILSKDSFFADFLEDSDTNILVLEDSDNFLAARSSGNDMMHRFLNVSNGLITSKGKKLIFSTNLPSVRDVDSALTRPGRCFDIINFDAMGYDSAQKLANALGIELNVKSDPISKTWSIAEIFHEQNAKPIQKFGFNQ